MLKIVKVPNQVLTTPVHKVTTFDAALKKLTKDMEKTLIAQTDPEGVGLAAPQIGISKAIFIMKSNPDARTFIAINPHILESDPLKQVEEEEDEEAQEQLEGCLSIPRFWAPINRSDRVHLSYHDLEGKKHEQWFEGFEAIIVQHEVDHLQGILFTQRALEQNVHLFEEKEGKLKSANLK